VCFPPLGPGLLPWVATRLLPPVLSVEKRLIGLILLRIPACLALWALGEYALGTCCGRKGRGLPGLRWLWHYAFTCLPLMVISMAWVLEGRLSHAMLAEQALRLAAAYCLWHWPSFQDAMDRGCSSTFRGVAKLWRATMTSFSLACAALRGLLVPLAVDAAARPGPLPLFFPSPLLPVPAVRVARVLTLAYTAYVLFVFLPFAQLLRPRLPGPMERSSTWTRWAIPRHRHYVPPLERLRPVRTISHAEVARRYTTKQRDRVPPEVNLREAWVGMLDRSRTALMAQALDVWSEYRRECERQEAEAREFREANYLAPAWRQLQPQMDALAAEWLPPEVREEINATWVSPVDLWGEGDGPWIDAMQDASTDPETMGLNVLRYRVRADEDYIAVAPGVEEGRVGGWAEDQFVYVRSESGRRLRVLKPLEEDEDGSTEGDADDDFVGASPADEDDADEGEELSGGLDDRDVLESLLLRDPSEFSNGMENATDEGLPDNTSVGSVLLAQSGANVTIAVQEEDEPVRIRRQEIRLKLFGPRPVAEVSMIAAPPGPVTKKARLNKAEAAARLAEAFAQIVLPNTLEGLLITGPAIEAQSAHPTNLSVGCFTTAAHITLGRHLRGREVAYLDALKSMLAVETLPGLNMTRIREDVALLVQQWRSDPLAALAFCPTPPASEDEFRERQAALSRLLRRELRTMEPLPPNPAEQELWLAEEWQV
jgi:hypothetical protein